MHTLSLREHLTRPVSHNDYETVCRFYGNALDSQKAVIESLIRKYKPGRVACLGAGYLIDIPIEILVQNSRDIYLVDWIEGICRQGITSAIIKRKGKKVRCAFCKLPEPQRFCSHFNGRRSGSDSHCRAWQADPQHPSLCVNYKPAEQPAMIQQDITCGRATAFSETCRKIVQESSSPVEAFEKAIEQSTQLADHAQNINIDSDSIDLVTSSMIVSQFDHEPYGYFSRLLEARFGRAALLFMESTLTPLMETLRSTLFLHLAYGHIAELYRLTNKRNGLVYFNVELFRSLQDRTCFMVQDMHHVLALLDKHFYFDFDGIRSGHALKESHLGEGSSIIQHYLLRPRASIGETPD